MQVLPTTVGGPVIVCLDTSWSMTGPRERLAKAGRYVDLLALEKLLFFKKPIAFLCNGNFQQLFSNVLLSLRKVGGPFT